MPFETNKTVKYTSPESKPAEAVSVSKPYVFNLKSGIN